MNQIAERYQRCDQLTGKQLQRNFGVQHMDIEKENWRERFT